LNCGRGFFRASDMLASRYQNFAIFAYFCAPHHIRIVLNHRAAREKLS
jgi:hypothetical protein